MRRNLFNQKIRKNLRGKLRKTPTKAEGLLWFKIRNEQLGYKFRRQHGIGRYIADFYCPELKLAVEIDGGVHFEEKNIVKDKQREEYFKKLGIAMVRYTNLNIVQNIDNVLVDFRRTMSCRRQPHPKPPL